jgi:hypothetical protein
MLPPRFVSATDGTKVLLPVWRAALIRTGRRGIPRPYLRLRRQILSNDGDEGFGVASEASAGDRAKDY